jgi:dTDP-4-dehydrorhamnose reductase
MKILVFGSGGQLGYELMRRGQGLNLTMHGVDYPQTDITVKTQVIKAFAEYRPQLVLNAAAYTNVDGAESEPELAMAINREGPANIARLCAENKIPLVHISTDYVFDGTKGSPYLEKDPVSPVGVYAQSKAEGETTLRSLLDELIILRTAWLYGSHGHNFVKTILKLAREKAEIRVVSDQYGSPTSAADLAETILTIADILRQPAAVKWGTYHYCGRGIISWHEFAQAIVDIGRHHTKIRTNRVEPIKTVDYPTRAVRPAFSALDCGLLNENFGISPKPWRESLKITIQEILAPSGGVPPDGNHPHLG